MGMFLGLLSIIGMIVGVIMLLVGIFRKKFKSGGIVFGASIVVFILALAITPGSDKQQVASSDGEEAEEVATEPSEAEQPAESNETEEEPEQTAEPVTLGAGTFYVGEDVNPGRYVVSTESMVGNFVVYEESGMPTTNEMLGTQEMAVDELTVDLEEGQEIEIMGLDEVNFEPKE